MNCPELTKILTEHNLKVTPQRVAVLDALMSIGKHPGADAVKEYVRQHHPNMALGTIYKILDTLCERNIIRRVKTDRDFMRYDIATQSHHHIYYEQSDCIDDYYDATLDKMLQEYFAKKPILNFSIKEINLQIVGTRKECKPTKSDYPT